MEKETSGEMELEQELEALYRKVASPDQREDDSYPAPPPKPETAEPEKPETPEQAGRHVERQEKRPASRFSRGLSGAVLLILVLGLAALFFWPTIYHYDALNMGGEVYPLRVNRLTGEAAYFDGLKWSRPPLFMSYKEPAPGNLKVQTSAAVPSEAKDKQARIADLPVEQAPAKTRPKTGYAIQIRAFPEIEGKIALSFAEDVKKRLPEIYVETVHVPGRGVWHRILFGNFESVKEASGSMKKHHLLNTYPGSFVQKKSGE
jgi:hypothetical protein